MNYEIEELLSIYDLNDNLSSEAEEYWWLVYTRVDGIQVVLVISTENSTANIVVKSKEGINISSVGTSDVAEIRVLESDRNTMEIISSRSRTMLALDGGNIMNTIIGSNA